MNRGEIASEVAFLINFNETQTNQDYTAKRIRQAMQHCYEREMVMAKNEGYAGWFKKSRSVVWPASQVTLELPDGLGQKSLLYAWDITASDPGIQLIIRNGPESGTTLFWQDYKTLQWGSSGPTSDTTIRFYYIAEADKIVPDTAFDDQSYEFLPPEHQWLLVWSTAVFLREVGDEGAPQSWLESLGQCRRAFWKHVSRAKLWSDWTGPNNPYQAVENKEFLPLWR